MVIGSVKTNLGHTQAAAGVAGIIKVVPGARSTKRIPQSLHHFDTPSPHIPWAELLVTWWLPRACCSRGLERSGAERRIAGVSSFGISGTNAHVVLEEAPAEKVPLAASVQPAERGAPIHGGALGGSRRRATAALRAQCGQLAAGPSGGPHHGPGSPATWRISLATTRSVMEQRLALVGDVCRAAPRLLDAALGHGAGADPDLAAVRGACLPRSVPKVVFVFPGQGSQWLGMGRALLADVARLPRSDGSGATAPFRPRRAGRFSPELVRRARTVSRLGRIDVVQPTLFAMSGGAFRAVALVGSRRPTPWWASSMGEVAAAHVAGALSLEDAVAIICRRSRLLRRISGQGEMAVVELSLGEAEAALRGYEDRLSVAVSNSPRSTVLSGEPAALGAVLAGLEAKGVFCRRVKVDVASHSPQVDSLRQELVAALSAVKPQPAAVPMRSTVTGAVVRAGRSSTQITGRTTCVSRCASRR